MFFDIPPPSPEVLEQQASAEKSKSPVQADRQEAGISLFDSYNDRPKSDIETLNDWEQVLEMLPKDYKKKADWSAAIEQGLIRPRPGKDPKTLLATAFKYDFIIPAEKPKNEAYFPHSAHTEWLGCKNCHMTVYPYQRNPASMKEMRAGESCGACHGKVAFSLRQCKRCHLKR